MEKNAIINEVYLDIEKFIHFIYKLRDRLATAVYRNFFTKEVIEDLFADSLNILIIKYINTGRVVEVVHAKQTLYNIIRIEFQVVLGKKLEEFYYSLGRQKYESFLYQKRQRKKIEYIKWQQANYGRRLELARQSYHRNKHKHKAKKYAYHKIWQQTNKDKKKEYNRKYREKKEEEPVPEFMIGV